MKKEFLLQKAINEKLFPNVRERLTFGNQIYNTEDRSVTTIRDTMVSTDEKIDVLGNTLIALGKPIYMDAIIALLGQMNFDLELGHDADKKTVTIIASFKGIVGWSIEWKPMADLQGQSGYLINILFDIMAYC